MVKSIIEALLCALLCAPCAVCGQNSVTLARLYVMAEEQSVCWMHMRMLVFAFLVAESDADVVIRLGVIGSCMLLAYMVMMYLLVSPSVSIGMLYLPSDCRLAQCWMAYPIFLVVGLETKKRLCQNRRSLF